jgi:hypothetical protein
MKTAPEIRQKWLTRQQAMEYTGYKGSAFDNRVKAGTFIAYKTNPKSDPRFKIDQIDRAMEKGRRYLKFLGHSIVKEQSDIKIKINSQITSGIPGENTGMMSVSSGGGK